ncbi:hypothetical protein RvY_16411-1 [Ramazzottius varieornatus]|uniref:Ferric reductase NAD binding domain-containing protein n=1 Tax=Ramazzottius varieornatus TaxID=947166 RepID=A0A1D1VZ81_RAMVA|nr:hypothetical protein RvY_16411-1 [Ramazzottius varieornatus]
MAPFHHQQLPGRSRSVVQSFNPIASDAASESTFSFTDRLVLHIRSAGDWTRRLYDLFDERITLSTSLSFSAKQSYKMSTKRAGVMDRRRNLSILSKKRPSMMPRVLRETDVTVCIHGPYGTPTGLVFECEHAVLICAGIGVTPFASILQSIVTRHQSTVETEVSSHEPIQLGRHVLLKKVDFIWVVRDQRSLEWFVELLQQLDAAQHREERFQRFLEIHIYVTSATSMSDLQSFALTSALETFYQTHQRDLITGIAARARHGRPKWQTVFETIKEQSRGKVSVFYCGPHPLSRELRQLSHQHNFRFYKESF